MKTVKLLIMMLLCSYVVCAQHKKFNQALADSLAHWEVLDQSAAGMSTNRLKTMKPEQFERYKDSVFSLNEQRLKGVMKQYGFPGYDLVGQKGSNSFWLIVQHCDKDVDFQKQVLKAMEAELINHNADPKNYAYLTDRVLLNTGKKQLYGTQLTYNTDSCQAVPKPMRDSLLVNQRRHEIGLEPIENYLNWMSQMHFDMNKAVYLKKGIKAPKLVPEVKLSPAQSSTL
jgi:hypothetical protein